MKVFKFGGASVKDAPAMRNVASIISRYNGQPLLVVVSALGKTTNALEDIARAFFDKQADVAAEKIDALEKQHQAIAAELVGGNHPVLNELRKLFTHLRQVPELYRTGTFDFLYDQVVCMGELFSTHILSAYMQHIGLPVQWMDARNVIKTDAAYREAKINWPETRERVHDAVKPLLLKHIIVITQGFIGSTSSNHSTTLGREGSDFTAAVFSNILHAQEQVIWKDVPGVLNANPALFSDAVKIDQLPYEEAVEMTYYGAQVIHPKTIKPLQNKNIPLHVRSFIDSQQPGTLIGNFPLPQDIPPIIVFKKNQVLLNFSTRDFSFMAEESLGRIIDGFARLRIKTNIMQNAAISMSVCIDHNETKLGELIPFLEPHFNIRLEPNVEMLTIRHYNEKIVHELTRNRNIIITQKTPDTIQFVMKG